MSKRTRRATWSCLPLLLLACQGSARDALWARPQGQSDAGQAGDPSCELATPELPPQPSQPMPDPARRASAHRYFQISVQDQDGAPVPGATLRTVNRIELSSDTQGKVAFYEPDLMGLEVFFFAERAGYELAADGFGYRGKALKVEEGGAGVITLQRGAASPPSVVTTDRETRLLAGSVPSADRCFALRVVDQATKRGVPLVFLRCAEETLISDSQGMAAYCNPDQLGKRVRFAVSSHGYTFAAGEVELAVEAGESAVLELTRLNIAERLLRSTGQGIYRDSQLLGLTLPSGFDTLRGQVMAQDAVSTAVHRGKLFWLWGNTDRPSHPLGNFYGSAATSELSNEALALGLSLDYFVGNNGNARAIGQALAPSNLPSWLGSLVSLPDAAGKDQLFAVYAKPRGDLSLAARGLAQLDEQQTFQAVGVDYPTTDFVGPRGQPVRVQHGADEYVYFAAPLRMKARAESLLDPKHYEVFSAFGEARGSNLLRGAGDQLAYAFRNDARATSAEAVANAGLPKGQSLEGHLADAQTGAAIKPAGEGAQAFRAERQRFVRIFQQLGGISSFAGEIWYAEADTPLGPWVYAQKILTHDRYTFYAPWIHTSPAPASARFLYFEGSYTTALAGDGVTATPRYERNQILYRLDLEDERLRLPVAVYDLSDRGLGDYATFPALPREGPARAALFFAPEVATPGTRAVHWSAPACAATRKLLLDDEASRPALFHAFAPDATQRPAQLVPLYEFVDAAGTHAYTLEQELAGFARSALPLAYVWPSPIDVKLPLADYALRLTADAGEDQCLREQAPGRGARVRLDGSKSQSLDGKLAHFAWYLDDARCPFAEAARAELRIGVGVHALVLEVRDDAGNLARDAILLEISE